jgi:hypothetical protein
MTDLYVEYTGHGSATLITKWRPNVTTERLQELLSVPRATGVQYAYATMGSNMAHYWEGVMRIQAEKMINDPIDIFDGTWTMVDNGVETPVDKQSPQS